MVDFLPKHSAVYHGTVRHRRFLPRTHAFRYRVFMMYFDLDELNDVLAMSPWWSVKPWSLARFARQDYFGDSSVSIKQAVLSEVNERLGLDLSGPVRMLTNCRYFGFIINPITIYYCFDKHEQLQAMLLEVTNTPWREKIPYVLNVIHSCLCSVCNLTRQCMYRHFIRWNIFMTGEAMFLIRS